jgi:hypothetical protein
MKFKRLAMLATFATIGLSAMTHVAHAEGDIPPAAMPAPDVAAESNEFKMFRFATRMDKLEFIKQAMHLNAEQEKKFLEQYDRYDIELAALNDERLTIIKDYAANFESITDKDADKLVKRSLSFRKQRAALLEKYYAKVAKATSKVIAARFLQVEAVLQGASDVVIGASIPLMEK